MGSDSSPKELFKGVIQAAEQRGDTSTFVVFATPVALATLESSKYEDSLNVHIEFHPVDHEISMDEEPLSAVRRKKNASLLVGLRFLKEGHLDALVSSGNTGALITASRIILTTFPGIQRPALLALLPTKKGTVALIDAGGNIENSVATLVQYAQMGVAYQRCFSNIKIPTVGLLNIGTEVRKGTLLLRGVYAELEALSIQKNSGFYFKGNVEARELFEGKVDLLVTDGFTGNILLKAVEGTASYTLGCFLNHLQDPEARDQLQAQFDYVEYPGALVCGVKGIVIKCHGNASKKSIYKAICTAMTLVERNLISQLSENLYNTI
ncbi:MAG: phosphate acyltransferase PlsX [Parachlamydiaceae bacterium]|nr:phosphate acyltransferase PlsX [Parachlamydiaceae bacterium]